MTVFVTSPKESRWREVRKAPGSEMLFLPVYSEEEMFRLRDLCFPHLDHQGVEKRYSKWGGIPRSVLLHTSPDSEEARLAKIQTLDYAKALMLLDGVESSTPVTDVAVHIKIKVSRTLRRAAHAITTPGLTHLAIPVGASGGVLRSLVMVARERLTVDWRLRVRSTTLSIAASSPPATSWRRVWRPSRTRNDASYAPGSALERSLVRAGGSRPAVTSSLRCASSWPQEAGSRCGGWSGGSPRS